MAKYKQGPSHVVSFVLMVTFGLLAAIVAYATWKGGNFELRSKAGTQEILLKQWTFDSGSQDWSAADWQKKSVEKGVYSLIVDTKTETRERKEVCTGTKKRGNYKCRQRTIVTQLDPKLERGSIDTVLLYPFNRLKIRMSVLPSHSGATGGVMYEKKLVVTPISFNVFYKIEGKSAFETPIPMKVLADGSMQEVMLEFPKEMSLKKLTNIKLSFVDIKSQANTAIAIDTISIVGLKEATKGDTIIGTVTKVTGDAPGSNPRTAYHLKGYYEGQRTRRLYNFTLMPGFDPVECPTGRACPQNVRRININFDEFVGKDVIAKGIVTDTTLYVLSMELNLPCQEVPPGCTDPSGAMMCKIGLMEGYRWCEPTPTPRPQVVGPGCEVGGCSGELCVTAGSDTGRMSRCMYKQSYACYKSAACEKQASGQCGWTMTQEVAACIESASGPDYIEFRQGSRNRPAPEGCSYQQVQCIQAPCDPILVCPTP